MKRIALIALALLVANLAAGAYRQKTPKMSVTPSCKQGLPSKTAKNDSKLSATQRLAERNDSEGPLSQSVWGFLAVNLEGDTLVALNPDRRLVPASNLKLITTGAALMAFGGDHRFNTTFATDAPVIPGFDRESPVRDSVLLGNLYIMGGGDPLIGEIFPYLPAPDETFSRWGKVLETNGIRYIAGDIIGDGSYFSGPQYHPDWNVEDIETRDGVVPSGLTWRGKMGDSLPDNPSTAARHYREWLELHGTVRLQAAGLPAEAGPIPPVDSLLILGTVESMPLRDIIRIANCQSDNFIAETLLKELGKRKGDGDDYKQAVEALKRSLAPLGLMASSGQMRFADGSGLSRKNYVSPAFMVSFLKAMYRSRERRDFLASLPFAGEPKTTLENRLPKRPYVLRHRIRMKSGSMNGVRCFSGYILPSDGKTENTIVFSILTNNAVASSSQVYPLIDSMIESLAKEN